MTGASPRRTVSGVARRRRGQCVPKQPSALAVVLRLLGAIDLAEGMPRWWTLFEGPAFAATGAVVLALQRQTDAPR